MGRNDKATVKLQWGIKNEKIVHISEIPKEERGLACGCICSNCKDRLLAKLGDERQYHFAHCANTECNIEYAHQTALHMLAKEIIEQEKVIKLPGLLVKFEDLDLAREKDNVHVWHSWRNRNLGHQYNDYIEKIDESVVAFDQVVLEKKISAIIPDIVARKGDRTYLIEIAVTHFTEENKRKAMEALGYEAIEINIEDISRGGIKREELKDILINQTKRKQWIFNSQKRGLLVTAEKKAKEILDEQKTLIKKNKYREKTNKRETAIEKCVKTSGMVNGCKSQAGESGAKTILQKYREMGEERIPFYLNIPIRGEEVFKCNRWVWQTILFDFYVYNTKTRETRQSAIEAFSRLKFDVDNKAYSLLESVIVEYFNYLEYLGFIKKRSGFNGFFGTVLVPHSLTPPNKEYARSLELALQQVSELSPSVDEDIAKTVRPQMAVIKK